MNFSTFHSIFYTDEIESFILRLIRIHDDAIQNFPPSFLSLNSYITKLSHPLKKKRRREERTSRRFNVNVGYTIHKYTQLVGLNATTVPLIILISNRWRNSEGEKWPLKESHKNWMENKHIMICSFLSVVVVVVPPALILSNQQETEGFCSFTVPLLDFLRYTCRRHIKLQRDGRFSYFPVLPFDSLVFFFFPILSFYLVEQTGRGSGELIIFPPWLLVPWCWLTALSDKCCLANPTDLDPTLTVDYTYPCLYLAI